MYRNKNTKVIGRVLLKGVFKGENLVRFFRARNAQLMRVKVLGIQVESEANKIVLGLAASRSRSEGEARAARGAAAQRGEAARGPREARRASPHQGADLLPKPLARALLPVYSTERRKARHIKLLGAARGLYPRTLQNALSRCFFDSHRAAQRVQNCLAP